MIKNSISTNLLTITVIKQLHYYFISRKIANAQAVTHEKRINEKAVTQKDVVLNKRAKLNIRTLYPVEPPQLL